MTLPSHDLDHGTSRSALLPVSQRMGRQSRSRSVTAFSQTKITCGFGSCIKRAVDRVGRRVAFIASGDLSHRLKPHAPAGYNPDAHVFDEQVVDALRSNAPQRITEIDHNLRRLAGECGYRSMLVAIGASSELPLSCEVLSYEAPFGVGYLVAQLTNQQLATDYLDPPALARQAVETYIRDGDVLNPRRFTQGLLAAPAPCFVSLKTLDGDLRGCIGTIEPSRDTLAQEIVANAISAATNDPRFDPVRTEELSNLVIQSTSCFHLRRR